ncbi:MAG: RidA family protein [Pseudomonadota bacterium]
MKQIHSKTAPAAIGPYCHGIITGNLMFCSGQTPLDPVTMKLVGGDIEAQTRQVFENISAVLEAAGLTLDAVVKTTVFLRNMADFPKMNGVYQEHFKEHRPARSTVEVSGLPMGAMVEMECIAEVDGSR